TDELPARQVARRRVRRRRLQRAARQSSWGAGWPGHAARRACRAHRHRIRGRPRDGPRRRATWLAHACAGACGEDAGQGPGADRAALADPARPSFGIRLLDQEPLSTWMTEDSFPSGIVEARQGRLEWTAAAPSGRTGAVQVVRIVARRPIGGPGWSGVMRLGR